MSRHVRHIHAGPNEWIAVHRDRPSGKDGNGGGGCLWIIIIIIIIIIILGAIFG